METITKAIALHPQLLEMLFAYKSKVTNVFLDVLGLYHINHIAITYIINDQLLAFSSTPAIEYNLFSTNLWTFDKTYQTDWFQLETQSLWQSLYSETRYDELYYIKQIKPHYPSGVSLAEKQGDGSIIYSVASHSECAATQQLFATQYQDFYKIGRYCSQELMPLFLKMAD